MPFLTHEPPSRVASLADLMGIAMALECEAVRRYGQLAAIMERRGDTTLAAIFRALIREEEEHVAAVEGWEGSLGLPPADAGSFVWLLPPDIAVSWEELAERSSITPYQALSLAVLNEQRAFAFYSYIAAHAEAEPIRSHAEALAREELGHAAKLRRERRAAFHRERTTRPAASHRGSRNPIASVAEWRALKDTLLSAGAAELDGLAAALRGFGDPLGAALLTRIADQQRAAGGNEAAAGTAATAARPADVAQALRAALAVAERLAEGFGDIAAQATDEAVLTESLRLEELAVGHIALLADHLHRRG